MERGDAMKVVILAGGFRRQARRSPDRPAPGALAHHEVLRLLRVRGIRGGIRLQGRGGEELLLAIRLYGERPDDQSRRWNRREAPAPPGALDRSPNRHWPRHAHRWPRATPRVHHR